MQVGQRSGMAEDTLDLPIPEGFDQAVARLPATVASWHVSASPGARHADQLGLRGAGSLPTYARPGQYGAGWSLDSREAAAARLRFQTRLGSAVDGELAAAIRTMHPWIDSTYDLVGEHWNECDGYRSASSFTFWQTGGYELVPTGTYQLECWYASLFASGGERLMVGWRVLGDGPVAGRVLHEDFEQEEDGHNELERRRARKTFVKRIVDLATNLGLEKTLSSDHCFPGFNLDMAPGRRIIADVVHEEHDEPWSGIGVVRERLRNVRRFAFGPAMTDLHTGGDL